MQILVPLANDAVKDDDRMVYVGVGPNTGKRLDAALMWAKEHLPMQRPVWALGAGTDVAYHGGQTLGALAEAVLRYCDPRLDALTNRSDRNFYGTYEEVKWVVRAGAATRGFAPELVQFVFFGPSWHLWRMRFIWLLFFAKKWGRAKFVVTADGARFALRHEVKAWARIVLIRLGVVKSRDMTPYPPRGEKAPGITC